MHHRPHDGPTARLTRSRREQGLSDGPQRAEAVRRMVAALRPGGWLVIEDFDVLGQPLACPEARSEAEPRANRIRAGFVDLLAGRGVDLALGRSLEMALRSEGLVDTGSQVHVSTGDVPEMRAALAAVETANVSQVRGAPVAHGHASDREIERHLAALHRGEVVVTVPPLVSAWGRSPSRRPRSCPRCETDLVAQR